MDVNPLSVKRDMKDIFDLLLTKHRLEVTVDGQVVEDLSLFVMNSQACIHVKSGVSYPVSTDVAHILKKLARREILALYCFAESMRQVTIPLSFNQRAAYVGWLAFQAHQESLKKRKKMLRGLRLHYIFQFLKRHAIPSNWTSEVRRKLRSLKSGIRESKRSLKEQKDEPSSWLKEWIEDQGYLDHEPKSQAA